MWRHQNTLLGVNHYLNDVGQYVDCIYHNKSNLAKSGRSHVLALIPINWLATILSSKWYLIASIGKPSSQSWKAYVSIAENLCWTVLVPVQSLAWLHLLQKTVRRIRHHSGFVQACHCETAASLLWTWLNSHNYHNFLMKPITTDCVESFCEFDKGHVEVHILFLASLLELPCCKDPSDSASCFASVFPATDNKEILYGCNRLENFLSVCIGGLWMHPWTLVGLPPFFICSETTLFFICDRWTSCFVALQVLHLIPGPCPMTYVELLLLGTW